MNLDLNKFLKINPRSTPVEYTVSSEAIFAGFRRQLIKYSDGEGSSIPAYLFLPSGSGPFPAVLVHHQHNGERHFGKSEVAGLCGDPLQAFGPALAERGFVVLAPDSICFEDRRVGVTGVEPAGELDWLQHFNELTYRIVRGDTLMRKVLDDASVSLSLLAQFSVVDSNRLGVFGHSYGGNTALFQAATDDRAKFACASGAVCSYAYKMDHQTPFEFALTIPGFCENFDLAHVLKAIAPRNFLVVSADGDKYSKDAPEVVKACRAEYLKLGAESKLELRHFDGGHPITQDRFDFIVDWISKH